ncbi:MAG: glycosyltransferase family 4 protein [Fimbriimonadaceae bacterium]|nr:glycosyltransferase family 4 protein [Fimbriimonadaceae bacterium]
MRVLIVNREDAYTAMGGDTVQMDQTARHLRELGVEVEIGIGAQPEERFREFDLVHLFNLQTFDFTASQLRAAKDAGRKVAVSTIWWDFAVEEVLDRSPKWRLARKVFGTRIARAWAQRRIERQAYDQRAVHRSILTDSDMLLPNSDSEAVGLRALASFTTPIHVVPNGIDPHPEVDREGAQAVLEAHGLKPDAFILIAARVEPVKNQLAYIRAIAPSGLTVACAGAPRPGYAEECAAAGAILLGQQPSPVLHGLYALCRLHALPSLRETPGLASLEAALAGAPIVSTEVGSARDYFGDRADYVDPHSLRSMLSATRRALSRPRSQVLSEHVANHFTWRRAAEETLKAYTQTLR